MKRVLRENGLSIVLFILFAIFLAAQSATGLYRYNEEQRQHDQPIVSYSEYVKGGEFLEATMENWESEFLQMFMFILLTTFLHQKGSAESNQLDCVQDPPQPPRPDAPWPVRRGGIAKTLYGYSLSVAFFVLFAISIVLHAIGGAKDYSEQQIAHGGSGSALSNASAPLVSGLNHSKTGRANSSRSSRWWCSPSSCGKRARQNRSPSIVRIARPESKRTKRTIVHRPCTKTPCGHGALNLNSSVL